MKKYIILFICLLLSCQLWCQALYFTGAVSQTWSTVGNWSTSSGGSSSGTVPGSTTPVIFDVNSTKCHITGAVSIKSIEINSSFTDTIFVDDSLVVSLTDTFKQAGGTFNSKNAKLTFTKGLYNTGGTFNASTKTLTLGGGIYNNGSTFNHDSGTVIISTTTNVSSDLACHHLTFSIVSAISATITIASGKKMQVVGDLKEEINSTGGTLTLNGPGKIEFTGNLYQASLLGSTTTGGNVVLSAIGNHKQFIYGNNDCSSGKAYLPAIEVNKSGDTLFLHDTIGLMYGMKVTAGNMDATKYNSCVFLTSGHSYTTDITYNNVVFYLIYAPNHTISIDTGKVMTVKGSLRELLNASGTVTMTINGPGKIQLEGDLYQSPVHGTNTSNGNVAIEMIGTNKQYIYGNNDCSNGRTYLPRIQVTKTGDTLFLKDTIGLMYGMNIAAGTVNTSKFNSCVYLEGSHVYSTDVTYNDVIFYIPSIGTSFAASINTGKTLTIKGSMREILGSASTVVLTINGPGTLALEGNYYQATPNATATTGGNVVITLNGSTNQHLYGNNNTSGTTCYLREIKIDKTTDTVFLHSAMTSVGGFNHVNGIFDATTYGTTVQLVGSYVFSNDITFNHLIINSKTTSSISVSINSGKRVSVKGDLSFILNVANASCNYTLNGPGTLELYGNLVAPPTGHASSNGGGNALIKLLGTGNQSITGNTTEGMGRFPSILVDKPSGTITLDKRISMAGNFEVYDDTGSSTDTTFVSMHGAGNLMSGTNLDIYGVKLKGSGVVLNGDLQLKGGINLSTFNLSLNAHSLYLKTNATNAISYTTGGLISDTSVFTSLVKWRMNNTVSTNYVIPFKTAGGTPLKVELVVDTVGITDSLATEQSFNITTYATSTSNTPFPFQVDSLVDSIGANNSTYVMDRYWLVMHEGFETVPACTYKIMYDPSDYASPNSIIEANQRVQIYNGYNISELIGSINTSTNVIEHANLRVGSGMIIIGDNRKPSSVYSNKFTKPFATLTKELNASFYQMNGNINFVYREKYNALLHYKVFDWKRDIKLCSEAPCSPVVSSIISNKNGINYHSIPANSSLLDGSYYTLEVTNEKGEMYQLRFKFKKVPELTTNPSNSSVYKTRTN